MNLSDIGNGFFEGGLAVLLTYNIKSLIRDKEVKGASLLPSIFVTIWGYWNLYYYPSLHQWISFVGGLGVCFMNTWWLSLAFYYKRQQRKDEVSLEDILNTTITPERQLWMDDMAAKSKAAERER